jgi:phosphate/sulfate permease
MSSGSGLIHRSPLFVMAWVLTLSASMILAGFLFWGFRNIF